METTYTGGSNGGCSSRLKDGGEGGGRAEGGGVKEGGVVVESANELVKNDCFWERCLFLWAMSMRQSPRQGWTLVDMRIVRTATQVN